MSKMADISLYLHGREKIIESSIAAEKLGGNSWKEACEKSALAEIIAVRAFMTAIADEGFNVLAVKEKEIEEARSETDDLRTQLNVIEKDNGKATDFIFEMGLSMYYNLWKEGRMSLADMREFKEKVEAKT